MIQQPCIKKLWNYLEFYGQKTFSNAKSYSEFTQTPTFETYVRLDSDDASEIGLILKIYE